MTKEKDLYSPYTKKRKKYKTSEDIFLESLRGYYKNLVLGPARDKARVSSELKNLNRFDKKS